MSLDLPGAQMVKNLPAMQETRVWSLGQKDPLEKGMAASNILAWRIPWTEEPSRVAESDMTERLSHTHTQTYIYIYIYIINICFPPEP